MRHNVIRPCVSYSHVQPCISYKHVIIYVYLKSAWNVKYAQPTLTAQRPSNSESCSSDWSTIFFDLMLKAVSVPSPLKQQQQKRATVVSGVDYSYYALQSGTFQNCMICKTHTSVLGGTCTHLYFAWYNYLCITFFPQCPSWYLFPLQIHRPFLEESLLKQSCATLTFQSLVLARQLWECISTATSSSIPDERPFFLWDHFSQYLCFQKFHISV